jgi:hypothetical protein
MAEVTYLIGAGASAECLPVVKAMAEDVQEVFVTIRDSYSSRFNGNITMYGYNLNLESVIQELLTDLNWIKEACKTHYSIDTYAKKLYLVDREKLDKLKLILSFYFTFVQITKPTDKRYDNFWASILTSKSRLPSKIKLLSWNYDFQLEQSYINMSSANTLQEAESSLNMLSPGVDNIYFNDDAFGIIKLNGSARVHSKRDRENLYMCDYCPDKDSDDLISDLVANYGLMKGRKIFRNLLTFAWENENRQALEESLEPFIRKTKVLAVIGYSFPFFNREIDLKIFSYLTSLETIYIQDRAPEVIKERLVELVNRPVAYKLIKDTDQFVFPKELEIV